LIAVKTDLCGVLLLGAEYFKYIFDYSPLPIYIFQDATFRMVNHKMVQITGYSGDELLSINFLELIYSEDRQLVADHISRRLAGESMKEDYAFRAINKHGNIIHVRGYFSVIDFEGCPAVLGQLLNISEQRSIEAALRKSKKELAEKVDYLNALIRILSIADAYDAMTSDRPYRQAMTHLEAVSELTRCSGTQFDPHLVAVFLDMLEETERKHI